MTNIIDALNQRPMVADGAMGTMLQGKGMAAGASPEVWMLANPEKILEVTTAYVKVGAEIIETNTFGANRLKLAEHGHGDSVGGINATAVKLARQAAGPDRYVVGVIGPSGHFPEPVGDIPFEELMDVFAQQAQSLSLAGADMILLQTFSDLGEARAAYLGARKVTSLPIAVSMTYGLNRRTLTGTDPETAAAVFSALGADVLGVNCSTGPSEMLEIVSRYRQCCRLPILAEPNAGIPVLKDGQTVFPMAPEDFSFHVPLFLKSGVRYIGGCCGATPAHIREIAAAARAWDGEIIAANRVQPSSLASRSGTLYLGAGYPPRMIGERLSPTGRKALSKALADGDFDLFAREGAAQIQAGADLLDVNAVLPGTDEALGVAQIVLRLQQSTDCPLVIDSVNPHAIEQGLMHYHGKALVNSVNGRESSLSAILPLAKRYGAAVVALTLDEHGIPERAEDRLRIAERILDRAAAEGIPKEDVYIDCLVMAAAAGSKPVAETMRTLTLVKERLGLATILGVSNISHGMPNRPWLNQAYLAHAVSAGADLVFANPLDPGVRKAFAAGAFLAGRDPNGARYIEQAAREAPRESGQKPDGGGAAAASQGPAADLETLRRAILSNDRQLIRALFQPLIPNNSLAKLMDISVIPAMNAIGDDFARGDAFLPQLMLAAEGAAYAFDYLKSAMPASAAATLETVVLGTVAGDVHDVGKNIVKALLSSYGYKVVDLGKNVPAEDFIAAVKAHSASILGLSALMTTTMTEMGPVIQGLRREGLDTKVIVGGAALTREYAEIIHADAYVGDASEAHGAIRRLLDGDAL